MGFHRKTCDELDLRFLYILDKFYRFIVPVIRVYLDTQEEDRSKIEGKIDLIWIKSTSRL